MITASLGTDQSAACWIVVSQNGRFAYTTNTASGTVTGYSVDRNGALARLDDTGITANTGGNPLDAIIKGDVLFVLTPRLGSIQSFSVGGDGSLTPVSTATGVSSSAAGLLVR